LEIDTMKIAVGLAAVVSVGALLAGCASGPYYGPGPGPVAVGYDGYYDGFYGPVYDGYWRGGHFWWRDAAGHPFRRDNAGHFSHEGRTGFQHIHGEPGGGDRDHRPG
jgi:hypothetical protein